MCPYGNQLQLFHCFSLQEVSLKRSRCLTLEFTMNKDVNSIIAVVSSQAFYSLHLPLFFYSFVALALIWYHKSTRLEATHSVPRITNVSRHAQLHCRWASALLNLFIIAFLFMEFLTIIEPEMNHECSLVNTVCTNVFFFLNCQLWSREMKCFHFSEFAPLVIYNEEEMRHTLKNYLLYA